MTTLGVIHRIEDLQVVCFAIVFGMMAVQARRDETFRYLTVSYLLGSIVSVLDVAAPAPMSPFLQFTNLALISLRYGAMAFALSAFARAQGWIPRSVLALAVLPAATVWMSLRGGTGATLSAVNYATLGTQFLILAVMLLSRREKATRVPRSLLAGLFLFSVLIRCCQIVAVLRPTPGIVWLRDQLWFPNTTLVGCMVPFTIIWMMNARVYSDLRQQSVMDPLTGLMNRRGLQQAVVREMARYGRNRQNFAVAVADIDHFKLLNDNHGHSFGDRVLEAFADICQRTLRQTDVIARSGGEEFTFLMPVGSDSEMHTVVDRVRSTLDEANITTDTGMSVHSTVSIGVTGTAGRPDVTWEQLLQEADAALYEAKRSGRNRTSSSSVATRRSMSTDALDGPLPIS